MNCVICYKNFNQNVVEYICFCNNSVEIQIHYECMMNHLYKINSQYCPLCKGAIRIKNEITELTNFYIVFCRETIDFELKDKGEDNNNIYDLQNEIIYYFKNNKPWINIKLNENNNEYYGEGDIIKLNSIKFNVSTNELYFEYFCSKS